MVECLVYTINNFYIQFFIHFLFEIIIFKTMNRNGFNTDKESEDSFMGLDLEEDNVCRSASGSSDRMCTPLFFLGVFTVRK